jgi:hypothetical protein
MTPESILANWDSVVSRADYVEFGSGYESLAMVAVSKERSRVQA